jgi:hypothetical protein
MLQTANTPGVEFTEKQNPSQMEGYNAESVSERTSSKTAELNRYK